MNHLRLESVQRSIGGQVILDNVSMSFAESQSCAITGPSGSGKSTLLNLIGLLDQPCRGGWYWTVAT